MPRWYDVKMKVEARVIGEAHQLSWPMTVDIVRDKFVWLKSPCYQGWVHRDDLIESDQAMLFYSAQIDALIKGRRVEHLYRFRGDCFVESQQYDRAAQDYAQAIERDPQQPSIYLARARMYGKQGEIRKSIAECDLALSLNSNNAEAYYLRGRARWLARQYDDASADCEQALRLNPNIADALMIHGARWYARGDFYRALADYSRAIELDPAADYLVARARALMTVRNLAAASVDVERALKLEPKNVELLMLRSSLMPARLTQAPQGAPPGGARMIR